MSQSASLRALIEWCLTCSGALPSLESEAQGKVARRAQIAAEKHVLQLQADLQEAQEQQLHSKDTQIALQSRQITLQNQLRLDALENEKEREEQLHA